MSLVLKVPKNTVASIILKWKMLETQSLFLELATLPNRTIGGEGSWVREVTKNPMANLTVLLSSSVEMGELSRRTTISAALHQSGLYGSGQTEAIPQ
jgi:hypothetical protein